MAFQDPSGASTYNDAKESGGNLDILSRLETVNGTQLVNLLTQVIIELRVQNELLARGLNVNDDVEQMRQDVDTNFNTPIV